MSAYASPEQTRLSPGSTRARVVRQAVRGRDLLFLSAWCGLAAGLEMMIRARNSSTTMTRELTWLALEQFCPSLIAGALLTVVVVRAAPESSWMLPGLWQILYCLGIFASCRLLPRPTFWVAVFYLGTGLAVIALAHGDAVLSPWSMGLPFGVGQFLAALVLFFPDIGGSVYWVRQFQIIAIFTLVVTGVNLSFDETEPAKVDNRLKLPPVPSLTSAPIAASGK